MQSAQIDERQVLARYYSRTRKSAEMFRLAKGVTPGGVMAGIKFFEPYPIFMEHAKGSHITDVDGNDYVDFLMSYGALILGHGNTEVKRAIRSVFNSFGTTVTGTPNAWEAEYGRRIIGLYHREGKVRFTNSGLEATLLAIRLAKSHTGRRKIAKFEGHYHGAVDRLLFSYSPNPSKAGESDSPIPVGDSTDVDSDILSDSVVLPFNDWKGTERLLRARSRELSCVIMEPFEEGVIPADRMFLLNLRNLTRDLGIPLIFDEVKTGFRVRLGGAGEFYQITPDLTCLGKILGGGFPIGAVVGDSRIMDQLDPRGETGRRVFHSGTFNGNPVSLAAGIATLDELTRKGRFASLVNTTEGLKRALSSELSSFNVPHDIEGEGAMFNVYLTDKKVRNYRDVKRSDLRLRRLVDLELITRGVYSKPENRFCLSLAHSRVDVRLTSEAFEESLGELTSMARN